jgi:thioredoxin reductase (NADPH)
MSLIDTRREHMFPKLSPAEIDRLHRYGEVRRFSAGSLLMSAGKPSPGMIVLISGATTVTRHDRPGNTVPIVDMGAGEFIAEVGIYPAVRLLSTRERRPKSKRWSFHQKAYAA